MTKLPPGVVQLAQRANVAMQFATTNQSNCPETNFLQRDTAGEGYAQLIRPVLHFHCFFPTSNILEDGMKKGTGCCVTILMIVLILESMSQTFFPGKVLIGGRLLHLLNSITNKMFSFKSGRLQNQLAPV